MPDNHLKKRAEFVRAAKDGRKASTDGMVVQIYVRGDSAPARFGFTATKKLGNAVVRNRVKRRLREVARLVAKDIPMTGLDIVLIGRSTTAERPFPQLVADFRSIVTDPK